LGGSAEHDGELAACSIDDDEKPLGERCVNLEIYRSKARYYAAAFDWSDEHQVAGIAGLSGLASGRVLELMCGNARLLRAFASAGFETVGVDLSAPLLDIARREFSAIGLRSQWLEADVTDFFLDEACDLAVCPINSLAHLQTAADMARHLRAVSQNLRSGGYYWVQLDLKDASKEEPPEKWKFESDGESLEFEWSVIESDADFETHQYRIFKDGEAIFRERHRMKRWSYGDWIALLARSPFEATAAYDGDSFEPLRLDESLETRHLYWQQLVKLP
jgi:SAM-dependent methyltransferase